MVTTHVTHRAQFAKREGGQGHGKVGWEASKGGQNGIFIPNCPIVGPKLSLQGPGKARKPYNYLWKSEDGMGVVCIFDKVHMTFNFKSKAGFRRLLNSTI